MRLTPKYIEIHFEFGVSLALPQVHDVPCLYVDNLTTVDVRKFVIKTFNSIQSTRTCSFGPMQIHSSFIRNVHMNATPLCPVRPALQSTARTWV